jgi:hypothetical protein
VVDCVAPSRAGVGPGGGRGRRRADRAAARRRGPPAPRQVRRHPARIVRGVAIAAPGSVEWRSAWPRSVALPPCRDPPPRGRPDRGPSHPRRGVAIRPLEVGLTAVRRTAAAVPRSAASTLAGPPSDAPPPRCRDPPRRVPSRSAVSRSTASRSGRGPVEVHRNAPRRAGATRTRCRSAASTRRRHVAPAVRGRSATRLGRAVSGTLSSFRLAVGPGPPAPGPHGPLEVVRRTSHTREVVPSTVP